MCFHFCSYIPLVVPSVLEHYQTALRDPAFYMIWKRVLGLFQQWQEKLPHYKPEELAMPQVAIEKVDVDKLVTYFEYSYMNVTSGLPMNVEEGIFHFISGELKFISFFSNCYFFQQLRNYTIKWAY